MHDRDPKTGLAPQDLKSINPFGTAPYFRDTKVSPPVELSESGAILEYLLAVYAPQAAAAGAPRLTRSLAEDGAAEYAAYLQWLHFANGSLQPIMSRNMTFLLAGLGDDKPIVAVFLARTGTALKQIDDRLAGSKFLAGEDLSAADIMSVVSLSTMRGFYPKLDLGPYPNVLRYLKDVAARPAYQEAIRKGDHDMEPMIGTKVKGFTQFPGFAKALSEE